MKEYKLIYVWPDAVWVSFEDYREEDWIHKSDDIISAYVNVEWDDDQVDEFVHNQVVNYFDFIEPTDINPSNI